MMGAVETHGNGIGQQKALAAGMFPGKGLHLGHMRGTADGPPGLRPTQAETSKFVEGAAKTGQADAVENKLASGMSAVFSHVDGDGDGRLSKSEFFNFTEMVVRDGLAALMAKVGGGDGGDDGSGEDEVGGVAPPASDDGVADAGGATSGPAVDPTGGVAAPPAVDAPVTEILPLAPEAPQVVAETGDPVFDLTLSSVAPNFALGGADEAILALLDARQGYAEAALAA